jgi:hypothetical protein
VTALANGAPCISLPRGETPLTQKMPGEIDRDGGQRRNSADNQHEDSFDRL